MKKSLLAFVISASLTMPAIAGWVDDWVDNAVYSGGDSFKGRERTFVTGGNFALRNKVKTDYPIAISPPRFNVGCGGIDAFMGGFAFLDADYLGDKLQSMITVAPYIAIDMALKSMSKELSDTLKNAESIINALNGIQINECQAMKPVVSMAFGESTGEDVIGAWGEMLNAQAIKDNTTRFWNEFSKDVQSNDGKAPDGADLTKETDECPSEVTDLFKEGSLLKNVADKTGMDAHTDLMRGFLGDVKIKYDTVIQGIPIEPCPNNANSIDGFLFGSGQEKKESGACTAIGSSLYDKVYDDLTDIVSALEDPSSTMSPSATNLIKRSGLPIVSMLNAGQQMGEVNHIKASIAEVVSLYYASMATKDFYQNTYEALRRLQQTIKNPAFEGDRCNLNAYLQPAELAKELLNDANTFKRQVDAEMATRINIINQNQQYINTFMRLKSQGERSVRTVSGEQ